MLKIALVAVENALLSTLSGPLDIFEVSRLRWQQLHGGKADFCEAKIVAPQGIDVKDVHGLVVNPMTGRTDIPYDIVIVPAMFGDIEPSMKNRQLLEWLRAQHQQGACVCTVCAGTFLAAKAGLLDGRKATTHWALAAEFRQRFPDVRLHAERILIDEGDVITAGGVTSYLDLCIHLLHRFGSHQLATDIARIFLIDTIRQDQLPYTISSFSKNHGDRQILICQEWLEIHCTEHVTIPQMAAVAGLEERTFTRRFKRATAITPSGYLQTLRIEAARRLLERTRLPLESITRQVGYEDFSSFRRLFLKYSGLTPSAYRKRFSLMYTEEAPS